ncbi:MAG: hypothetical protein P8Z49_03875 [Acidobacteriota bacterium]
MKRLITALLGIALAGVVIFAFDPAAGETARIRLISLETILDAREASIRSSWKMLADVGDQIERHDKQTRENSVGSHSANQASALLKIATQKAHLEERRLEILRSLQRDYEEAAALKRAISESRKTLAANAGFVEGRWHITLMPSGTSGTVNLVQNGALVNGSYKLENGQQGNLQGTLVNGQLVLERIDSRYGRSGRFVLKAAKGENELAGTWFSYDVTSGQPLSGAVKMDRVASGGED